ncbi:MAG: PilZ domain-containing protein [Myxococcota bacterium]|jgi:uncharacterized protein (TIGR02266 family)
MNEHDNRRSCARVEVEVWVEERHGTGNMYLVMSANISEGGMFLDKTIPHPAGTLVRLKFFLPGTERPIACLGEIVHPGTGQGQLGMGVRFVKMLPEDEILVSRFVDQSTGRDMVITRN